MQSSFLTIGEICCAGSRLWLQLGLGLKNVAISIGSIILDINCPLWIERWSFCILLSSTMGNDPLGFWTCVKTSTMVWLNSHMLWEAGGQQMVDGFKRQEGICTAIYGVLHGPLQHCGTHTRNLIILGWVEGRFQAGSSLWDIY